MAESPPTASPATTPTPWKQHGILWRVGDVLRRTLLGVLGIFFFILGIQLMRTVAGGVGPLLTGILGNVTDRPWHALAFGWLLAYGVLSGSPVAAFSLGLFSTTPPLISAEITYLMIMGSRLGAAFIVLVIGAVEIGRASCRERV